MKNGDMPFCPCHTCMAYILCKCDTWSDSPIHYLQIHMTFIELVSISAEREVTLHGQYAWRHAFFTVFGTH